MKRENIKFSGSRYIDKCRYAHAYSYIYISYMNESKAVQLGSLSSMKFHENVDDKDRMEGTIDDEGVVVL